MDFTYTQIQGTWSEWNYSNLGTLPLTNPWQSYAFILNSDILPNLYVGQTIFNLTSDFAFDGFFNPQFKIGALLYKEINTLDCYTSNAANRELIGCLIIDNDNNLIKFIGHEFVLPFNTGLITLNVISNNEEIEKVNCFKKKVWELQCKFAKCVSKYLQQLSYGISNCSALEDLKDKKRILEVLNCYDTRDIINNTTDYNDINYCEIKELLNY